MNQFETGEFIEKHVDQILEHFDSVRIFVTAIDEEGTTQGFSLGGGNYYAQHGKISEWIVQQNEVVRERVRENGVEDMED